MFGEKVNKKNVYTLIMSTEERENLCGLLTDVLGTFIEDMDLDGSELTFLDFANLIENDKIELENGDEMKILERNY